MSRVFLIHGWTGRNDKDWFPWVKDKFEKSGYEVVAPEMPNPDYPVIETWVNKLKEVVREVKPNDIFIGHSIGCQAIERYLQTLPAETTLDKVILVAPWVTLTEAALDDPDQDNKIVAPWYHEPIDYDKIKKMARWIAIFSADDPWVSYEENKEIYRDKLNAKIVLENGKGHFTQEQGVREFPLLLEIAGYPQLNATIHP